MESSARPHPGIKNDMKNSVSLSIPRPCAESWNNFTPTPEGGFCGSCQKTVIDFTRMSDRQILEYLEQKRAHTCGRFRTDQLKTYTLPEPNSIRPGLTLLRAGILGLLLVFSSRPAGSKSIVPMIPTTEVTQSTPSFGVEVEGVGHEGRLIKGIVRDEVGAPMPGVSIYRKGATQGAITDVNGRFEFPTKLKAGDVLLFNFLGYTPIEYLVTEDGPGTIEISLAPAYEVMTGDVVVNGPYEETPDFDAETPAPTTPRR
jgi:hypothetical protein